MNAVAYSTRAQSEIEVRDARPVARPVGKPRFGLLYTIVVSMVTLVGLIETVVPPGDTRRGLGALVLFIVFCLMTLWVRCNGAALRDEGPGR